MHQKACKQIRNNGINSGSLDTTFDSCCSLTSGVKHMITDGVVFELRAKQVRDTLY